MNIRCDAGSIDIDVVAVITKDKRGVGKQLVADKVVPSQRSRSITSVDAKQAGQSQVVLPEVAG